VLINKHGGAEAQTKLDQGWRAECNYAVKPVLMCDG